MAKFVCGSCQNFCPEGEAKLRIKEKLLHFYELNDGKKSEPGTLVKSFSRSAAGIKLSRAKDLRTERTLMRTVEYLLKEILLDKRKPYYFAYEFIFDRLRAVRQEVIIQNFNAEQTIKLLEPIALFHAYSHYRLCEEPIDHFDPKICEQHLQECLKRILCCYDELGTSQKLTVQAEENRCYIEALYQIFNLGSMSSLARTTVLPKNIRTHEVFATTYSIVMNYHQGNIYRVLIGMKNLPHILSAVAALRLQIVRRKFFEMFSVAYNSKQYPVPLAFVEKLMIYEGTSELINDCKYFKLKISNNGNSVYFIKSDFATDLPPQKIRHEHFVEQKLKNIFVPEVLLLKKF